MQMTRRRPMRGDKTAATAPIGISQSNSEFQKERERWGLNIQCGVANLTAASGASWPRILGGWTLLLLPSDGDSPQSDRHRSC